MSKEWVIPLYLSDLLSTPGINEYTHAYIIDEELISDVLIKLQRYNDRIDRSKWYSVSIVLESGKIRKENLRRYESIPLYNFNIEDREVIYAYNLSRALLGETELYKGFLRRLPPDLRDQLKKLRVQIIFEALFIQGDNNVLLIVPNTGNRYIEKHIKPIIKSSGLVISSPIISHNIEDFLYWILIQAKTNNIIKSGGNEYSIKAVRRVLGSGPSITHSVAGRSGTTQVIDDHVVDWIIFNQEYVEEADVIITRKAPYEESICVKMVTKSNNLLFSIRPRYSEVDGLNILHKRLRIVNKLFTEYIPEIYEAYKSDSRWNDAKDKIRELIEKHNFEDFRDKLPDLYNLI